MGIELSQPRASGNRVVVGAVQENRKMQHCAGDQAGQVAVKACVIDALLDDPQCQRAKEDSGQGAEASGQQDRACSGMRFCGFMTALGFAGFTW